MTPSEYEAAVGSVQDPRLLRALARAWNWWRQLESSTTATIHDIAVVKSITKRCIGKMLRLAYLSPEVLKALVIARRPANTTIVDLITIAELPWAEQKSRVFG